jgi:hypothetical protein
MLINLYIVFIILIISKSKKYVFLTAILLLLLSTYNYMYSYEHFTDGSCPTHIIKEGDEILLYDPTKIKVPGVNPIKIKDLEEYKEFFRWQKKNNLNCPILYLESTQGIDNLNIKSSYIPKIMNHDLPFNNVEPYNIKLI